MTATTYNVPTMTCEHCKASIQKSVAPLPGVEHLNIDLAAKTVTVTGGDPEGVKAAIVKAGYAIA